MTCEVILFVVAFCDTHIATYFFALCTLELYIFNLTVNLFVCLFLLHLCVGMPLPHIYIFRNEVNNPVYSLL